MNLPIEPSGRFEQLDLRVSDFKESGFHFLVGDLFDVIAFGSEHFFPIRDGGIQAFHCDTEVFDVRYFHDTDFYF